MAEVGKYSGITSVWPIPANHSVNKPGLKDRKSRQQPRDEHPQKEKPQSDEGTGHNIDEYA